MNAWGAALAWGMLQVTLLVVFGCALYALARRRGPVAGAAAAGATLAAVLLVSALSVAPWPESWRGEAILARLWPDETPRADSSTTLPSAAEHEFVQRPSSPTKAKDSSIYAMFWEAFQDELRRAPVEQSGARLGWPTVVLGLFTCGAVLGLLRLAAGVTAVRSYRRGSRPIADGDLYRLVQALRRETGCRKDVELRESSRLSTPATVGCVRPLLLLPSAWREWSQDELRAVLAHEIAHVARGDYLSGLLAQVAVALHFYHPLMHWLVARLRLEQELAADAVGLTASGGRESYLCTLAGMALRQDDLAVSWAARPFLPTRGTFMRRIEMLRDTRKLTHAPLPMLGRAALIGMLAAAGLLITSLRPDATQAQAPTKPGSAATSGDGAAEKLSPDHVPADAMLVVAARPSAVFSNPSMAGLAKTVNETMQAQTGLRIEEIEQVTYAMSREATDGVTNALVLRSVQPHDWSGLIKAMTGGAELEEVQFGEFKYLKSPHPRSAECFYRPDDRTLIVREEAPLKEMFAATGRPQRQAAWAALWDEVAAGHAAAVFDPALVREEWAKAPEEAKAKAGMFAPLWNETTAAAIAVGLDGGMKIRGVANANSPEAATRIAKTLEALKVLFTNFEPQLRKEVARAPQADAGMILMSLNAAAKVVDSAKLSTEGSRVTLEADGPGDVAVTMAVVLPAIAKAREAAKRAQDMNQLKQLALGMHNYAGAHGQFPAATVIGPDGKTPHSWRVALLPYVEQDALYGQYRLNEPWDSENNKRVLAQMPAVFRCPADDSATTNSSYFVLTGEKTVFPAGKALDFRDIRDGMSNTLMIVEAKRDIPWTKPEDIPYDPSQPLPELGGFFQGGFNAALCDGAVRFFRSDIDQGTLRSLIEARDGNAVLIPDEGVSTDAPSLQPPIPTAARP